MISFGEINSGELRSLAAQLLAATTSNLSIMGLEMAMNFATIAIPDLLNSPKALSLNESQASWFGSLVFLTQPIGAIISVPMLDYCGRKNSNVLSNIPHLLGWILMYFAWNLPTIFLANSLLGIGIGLMESPICTYLGELSDFSFRGSLIMFSQVFSGAGILLVYFLGTVVNWRQATLYCLILPVCSMIAAVLAPDTPEWLLSKGRETEALKALRWLRGWTSKENVKEEFDELVKCTKLFDNCILCEEINVQSTNDCEHVHMNIFKRMVLKFKCLILCKETLRPLSFIVIYFTLFAVNGLVPSRPNLVNVCGALGMPGDPKNIVFIVGVMICITCFIQTVIIKVLGKRKTVISSALAVAVCAAGLSVYAKMNLEETVTSFDTKTFPKDTNYLPLVFLYLLSICFGLYLPWVMIGEIFPFRSRAISQGIAVASAYTIVFISTKTFLNLEMSFHLWGTFAIYAGLSFIGTVYLYLFTPETEGKTLQEIGTYYSGEFRIFADDPFINFFKRFNK